MVIVRFIYTAAVMVIVVWLLRAGNPVGGLVIVPAMAVWLRRDAQSGRLAARVRRAIYQERRRSPRPGCSSAPRLRTRAPALPLIARPAMVSTTRTRPLVLVHR